MPQAISPRALARRCTAGLLSALMALPPAWAQPGSPAAPQAAPAAPNLPSLGEVAASELSPADERRLGDAIMQQVRRDAQYLSDPETAEFLTTLGYQLVAASPARHMDFRFFAVRDATMNAFALPGGNIGVHTGLVLAAQSEGELAAVLAHEIGHVDQRHIARMIARQKDATAIAIGALLLALLAARSNSSSAGDLTQAAVLGGQAAAIQQQLNFSREAEREADRVGVQTLQAAGFDPRAMVAFFNRLQQGSRIYESAAAPAYLRTHPLTTERIADMQNRLQDTRVRQRADSVDFLLTQARLRVLQDDSLQGARDARAVFTQQLANRAAPFPAAAHYGLAVAALRLNQPAEAYRSAQTARALVKSSSAMLDKLVSESRHAAATTPAERLAAVQMARDATTRYPLSRLTALHYVDMLQRDGQHEAAVAYVREQIAISRSDPLYYSMLARSYAELGRSTLHHQAVGEAYALQGALPAAIEQFERARRANDADFYVLQEVDARLRQLFAERRREIDDLARQGRRPSEDDSPPPQRRERRPG